MTPTCSKVQSGPSLVIKDVHPGVALQEEVHGLHVAAAGGGQEGSPAQAVLLVDRQLDNSLVGVVYHLL